VKDTNVWRDHQLISALFFGSSSISGECMTDAKEEVFVIPETVSDPLDHLDPVVHSFKDASGEMVSCVRHETLDVHREIPGESNEGFDPAFQSHAIPLIPPCSRSNRVRVMPQVVELLLHDVHLRKLLVDFKQVFKVVAVFLTGDRLGVPK
jgi:hypothetical protein